MLAVIRTSVAHMRASPTSTALCAISRRKLIRNLSRSTAFHNNETMSNKPKSNSSKGPVNPGQLPKVSIKSILGEASPTVKVVVYTMIGIIATAETYTYGLWAYHRWLKPSQEVIKDSRS